MNTEDDTNNIEFIIESNSGESSTDDAEKGENISEPKVKDKIKSSKKKVSSVSNIEKKLWNVAKKYKSFFDKDEVPQIAESEEDRQEVSNAYMEVSTKRHRQLDSRVYQSLTKMQRTRDAKVALEGTTEKDRLRMIAWEVKIRLQPIIFAVGDSTIEMDIFNLHETGADVRIIEGTSQELLIEDNILDENSIAIIDDLPLRKLTKDKKAKLKKEIIEKFGGKIFSKDDFDRNIPLFTVEKRDVEIIDQLDFLKKPSFVIVEGGEGMINALKDKIDWLLIYQTPKLSTNNLTYNTTMNLQFLHQAKKDVDLMIWSRQIGH